MKTELKTKIVEVREVTITMTEEQYALFYFAIGNTSPSSRERAGMTEEQGNFFGDMFFSMKHPDSLEN